jgi:hypothetical protein
MGGLENCIRCDDIYLMDMRFSASCTRVWDLDCQRLVVGVRRWSAVRRRTRQRRTQICICLRHSPLIQFSAFQTGTTVNAKASQDPLFPVSDCPVRTCEPSLSESVCQVEQMNTLGATRLPPRSPNPSMVGGPRPRQLTQLQSDLSALIPIESRRQRVGCTLLSIGEGHPSHAPGRDSPTCHINAMKLAQVRRAALFGRYQIPGFPQVAFHLASPQLTAVLAALAMTNASNEHAPNVWSKLVSAHANSGNGESLSTSLTRGPLALSDLKR